MAIASWPGADSPAQLTCQVLRRKLNLDDLTATAARSPDHKFSTPNSTKAE